MVLSNIKMLNIYAPSMPPYNQRLQSDLRPLSLFVQKNAQKTPLAYES